MDIRDAFVRNHRTMQKKKSGDAAKNIQKYVYARKLDFPTTVPNHNEREDFLANNLAVECINNVGDLHAVDAIFHEDCCQKLILVTAPTGQKRGRPQEKYVGEAVEEIFCYLGEQAKDQYPMDGLMDQISGARPDIKSNKNLVECIRVAQMADAIMRTHIQTRAYDTKSYPPSDEFLNGANEMVPTTNLAFMDALIPERRKGKEEVAKKGVCISQAMISAFRPRSFLSPVLIGIA
ncbi:hypothetical protein PR048_015383 [Dryococelus australis]|uniref:Uncharacterized protein n=1 Tax=Dryococelus australis TaxID=614101 RepID=A0ABQ9HH30_9NEOP|nr:hypothetical protein PR048_015383 [Dryococelus australis]